LLGEGGQGLVKLAKNKQGELFALKFFDEPTLQRLVVKWRKINKNFPRWEQIPNDVLKHLKDLLLIE